jgi:hypothetical protein
MRRSVLAFLCASLPIAACDPTPLGTRDGGARLDSGRALDAASLDSGSLDAAGLDAAGLDAAGLDAGSPLPADAALPDAPGLDAPFDDAFVALDAHAVEDARAEDAWAEPAALPYPERDPMRLKEIQPDFWGYDDIAGNNAGGVAMNLVWASWEPSVSPPPCSAAQTEHDGHCFTVDVATDDAIAEWSRRGLAVTAIVYGVPAWAHAANVNCSPAAPGFEIFCSPDRASDYARFAGMLAERYDGRHGHGRVADFVIHNEVNANDWFDVGCGPGRPCDADTWIATYADSWNAAHDAIVAEQSTARAYISFEHHFASSWDAPSASAPLLSVETFLTRLVPRLGTRPWRIAYHPYAPNLFSPDFGADDWPRVTYGNLGVLLGWLHAHYPASPHAWQVHLTESGISSAAPQSDETRQARAVCDGLRNVLGTPGIEAYVYHRMRDNPAEGGLALGLVRADGTYKPAWSTWALANRADLVPPMLSCGFEHLPYTQLTRSAHPSRGHWASSRLPPSGFTAEQRWHLLRAEAPGTVLLFSCTIGGHSFLTRDPGCEGQQPEGPVGYIHDADAPGRIALHRCRVGAGTDHFVSTDRACEGQTYESTLGYALP